MFFGWECISLITRKRTIDFVITDRNNILTFIHCMQDLIKKSYALRISTPTIPHEAF